MSRDATSMQAQLVIDQCLAPFIDVIQGLVRVAEDQERRIAVMEDVLGLSPGDGEASVPKQSPAVALVRRGEH
jgi:hypothetical protein